MPGESMNPNSPVTDSQNNAGRAKQETARRTFRKRAVWFLAVSFFLAALGLAAYAVRPGPASGDTAVIIPKKTGFAGIRRILAAAGVIDNDIRFTLLARLLGAANQLKAGEYIFHAGQTPYQILLTMEKGKTVQRPVTIPEGSDLRQIADILAAGGWVDRDRFLALTSDPALMKEFGITAASMEGYLFPDTYYLSRENQDEAGIIRMMATRFIEVYDDIRRKSPSETSLSRHEIVTLASIVEKEAAQPEERPIIAGIFLNRLRRNMRLQSDPTVKYGREDDSGRLTRQDLEAPVPYNTYYIQGLPPGPIASPGRAAIAAVLNPRGNDYLYFVAKNDGTHYFSKTLEEHNRAVARYQK